MPELKLEIPEDLEFIRQVSKLEWSMLLNKLLMSKLEEIAGLKKILAKSKLTEKDVDEFSDKINKSLSQRYLD